MTTLADSPAIVLGVWMDKADAVFLQDAVELFGASEVKARVLREAANAALVWEGRMSERGEPVEASKYKHAADGLELAARWREGDSEGVKTEFRRRNEEIARALCG